MCFAAAIQRRCRSPSSLRCCDLTHGQGGSCGSAGEMAMSPKPSLTLLENPMLVIRPGQMDAFEQSAYQQFEDEMMAHSKEFSPRLCEVLGDEQLRVVVRSAIDRARKFGFTCRGPIR